MLASVTVRFQVPTLPAPAEITGTKPELKPPSRGSQGVAKDDWETEWLPPAKTKVMTELAVALTNWGSNLRPP